MREITVRPSTPSPEIRGSPGRGAHCAKALPPSQPHLECSPNAWVLSGTVKAACASCTCAADLPPLRRGSICRRARLYPSLQLSRVLSCCCMLEHRQACSAKVAGRGLLAGREEEDLPHPPPDVVRQWRWGGRHTQEK